MANIVPNGVDLSTGQRRPLTNNDVLTDTSGEPVTKDSVRVLSSVPVSLSSAGDTALYIVPSGKTVFVSEVIVAADTSTDIDTAATVSVGVTTNTDIVAAQQLVGLTATSRYYSLDVSATAESASATETISMNVATAATGAGSPSQTSTVYLLGIEV